ncbi:MAG: AAA family ATPase [Lachnospiraceae bacterium]|nr:AAA family ATPase [Lachnospiraceae bacterium]
MAQLDQIEQFNNGNLFPETYVDTYIATKHIAREALSIPEEVLTKLKDKIAEKGLYFGDESVLREIVTGLVKGNIILQGPPGTGKTTLAKILCEVFETNYDEVTAIADWTTYDTIGGLQPAADESGHEVLAGKNGCVVESIIHCCDSVAQNLHYDGKKQANWLILDELNRCEIDKAFGELFTALGSDSSDSLKSIRLWYEGDENKKRIYIPNRYRIIGAMNNIDKNFVYDISQGLSRRFTFVEILPPEEEYFDGEVENAKKQAQKRVKEKIESYGKIKVDDAFFYQIGENATMAVAERVLKEFIRHLRYTRSEDEAFLGLAIGTAQIIDAYETVYISLIMGEYDINVAKKEDLLSIIDSVVSSRILPQVDGYDYLKLSGFYKAVSQNSEFSSLNKTKTALYKYCH